MERANQTLQDRLVKEMRLRNICSMAAANGFLPDFMADVEREVRGCAARARLSAHRPWTGTAEALDDALARREERVLSKALTFSSAGRNIASRPAGRAPRCAAAKVEALGISPMAGCT